MKNPELIPYLPKIADYLLVASQLKADSPEEQYRRANTLAWELAMVLPTDLYQSMGRALSQPTPTHNLLSVVIEVRKLVLGEAAGDLKDTHVIAHAPGIGGK
ncbi:MAG: hypothetical protein V4773_08215 [Verrucomicrobiota bacterium]